MNRRLFPVKSPADFQRISQQQQMAEIATQAAFDRQQDVIPARYGNPTTSGLSFEITTSESSYNFPIELKD